MRKTELLLIFSILLLFIACETPENESEPEGETEVAEDTVPELSVKAPTENSDIPNLFGDKLLEEHSQWVEFENIGKVYFAVVNNFESVSAKHNYYLVKDGEKLSKLPAFYGDDMWIVNDFQKLTLEDLNNDGKKDILIEAEYVTGVGPTGMLPFTAISIYFNKDEGKFENDPAIDQEVNEMEDDKSLEAIKKYIKNRKAFNAAHKPSESTSASPTHTHID